MDKIFDTVIIGGGAAGYTAALYGARAGLETVVLEKLSAGGQMASTTQIDNYPGFEDGVDGFELGEKMQRQAERFGAHTEIAQVESVSLEDSIKKIVTSEGTFSAKTVVIATGANPRKMGLKDEDSLVGRGVNYCAACDGMAYRGKTVVVVGGGNSAAHDAMILSRICQKVIIVHRRDSLRATKIYHEPLLKSENVEFCWDSAVSELIYDKKLTAIKVKNVKTDAETIINCDGVFVSIGRAPDTEMFKQKLKLDDAGYIIADESTRTSQPGVFAVGDVRTKVLRQVITAAADGAVASHYIEEYLAEASGN